MALVMEGVDPAIAAVVEGRGRHLETLMRGSSVLEEVIAAAVAERNDRQAEKIPSCSDWAEVTHVQIVLTVEETSMEEIMEGLTVDSMEGPVEDPNADAPHKPSITMDKPKETVEGTVVADSK